ncbi:MAG: hypothetical protein LBH76_03555 [Propionibacteriaceae bacterium]|nr:hypothetical protein [Propionibacteriaceae bacterium]
MRGRAAPGAGAGEAPPTTGHPAIDAALAAVARLGDIDLDEHPERLAAAHAVVRAALDEAGSPGASPEGDRRPTA